MRFNKQHGTWRKRKSRLLERVADMQTHHPKPRGRVPVADGALCSWDGMEGCWRTISGDRHNVDRAAARDAFFAAKVAEREQRRAEAEALLAQQRADCERIDAEVRQLLQEEGASLIKDPEPPPAWFATIPVPTEMQSMPYDTFDYRADWNAASALGVLPSSFFGRRGCTLLGVQRSSAYWAHVERMLATHGSFSKEDFQAALPHVVAKLMKPIALEMATKASAWLEMIQAKPVRTMSFSYDSGKCVFCGALNAPLGHPVCDPCRAQPEPWCGRCANPVKVPSIKDGDAWARHLRRWPRYKYLLCSQCSEAYDNQQQQN